MINQLRIAERLRRLAAPQCEPWHSVDREVLDDQGQLVAKADTKARASYLCALHNNILSLCALVYQQCAKHVDRANMKKEQDAEPN